MENVSRHFECFEISKSAPLSSQTKICAITQAILLCTTPAPKNRIMFRFQKQSWTRVAGICTQLKQSLDTYTSLRAICDS